MSKLRFPGYHKGQEEDALMPLEVRTEPEESAVALSPVLSESRQLASKSFQSKIFRFLETEASLSISF